jgi:ATP-dependent Clp protease ATP-binding subunit ClpA
MFGKLIKGGTVRVDVREGTLHLTYEEPQKARISGQKTPLLTAE